jgi:hypothetical protein
LINQRAKSFSRCSWTKFREKPIGQSAKVG